MAHFGIQVKFYLYFFLKRKNNFKDVELSVCVCVCVAGNNGCNVLLLAFISAHWTT